MAATKYAQHVGEKSRRPGTVDRDTYLKNAISNAKRGQELTQAKLLDLDVIDIRSAVRQRENLRKFIAENLSNAALAKKYGVHVNTIERVARYESFSHLV